MFDVGAITPCNQFPRTPHTPDSFAFAIAQCRVCALVQTVAAPPIEAVVPHVPWMHYNEPEGHIAALTSLIEQTLTVDGAAFLGVGPFDEPLLQEAARRGFTIDALIRDAPARVLPGDRYPYLETLAERLTIDTHSHGQRRGTQPDVVVCRYLLEHCPNPAEAVRGLMALLPPGGTLVLEVPDSAKFIHDGNACFLWEEHHSYFTEASFRRLIERVAGNNFRLLRYPGVLEDALVAVITPTRTHPVSWPIAEIAAETDAYNRFAAMTARTKVHCANGFGTPTALIGTGHHALMALQIYQLQGAITRLCDDDKHKVGRYVPGYAQPIVPIKHVLNDPEITTCIFSVHPRSEARVLERLAPFLQRGGTCMSLYAGSQLPWAFEARACA